MLKKTIKFQDLDDNDIEEDFYFNLSKAEVAELQLGRKGGMFEYMQRIVDDEDGGQIILIMKEIISKACGMRSEDGRRFVKSEEITNDFMQTDAYSVLFMEMVTDAQAAAAFLVGLLPKDMQEETAKQMETLALPEPEDDGITMGWIRDNRDPTEEELRNMSKDELAIAFKRQAERKAAQSQ